MTSEQLTELHRLAADQLQLTMSHWPQIQQLFPNSNVRWKLGPDGGFIITHVEALQDIVK